MKQLLILLFIGMACWSCQSDEQTRDEEARNLEALFNEIETIAASVNCQNASSWAITEYGHKACGGPAGYIAYSTLIDTTDFLNRVTIYSNRQREFNVKWGVISDCALAPQPIEVTCENGQAVLVY